MTKDIRIGWLTLAFLAALAFAMGMSAIAHAGESTLVDRLILAQAPLASRKEEAVDPRELAEAIASVPKVTREWAALLLTIAAHESSLSDRIRRSEYRGKEEGDGGRASGLYQSHKNALNGHAWGSTSISVQTLEAARALRSGFYTCNHGKLPIDWVARTINGYAGRACDAMWPGLEQRLATFNRTVRKL